MEARQAALKEKAAQDTWIPLKERDDDESFGEKIDYSGDGQARFIEQLKAVMLTMARLPTTPRITSVGTVGMDHRGSMRNIWEEAVAAAKAAQPNDKSLLGMCMRNVGVRVIMIKAFDC